MQSPAQTVFIFLCKTFSKLSELSPQKKLFSVDDFSINSYIKTKNLYGYELVRAAK